MIALARRKRLNKKQQQLVVDYQPLMRKVIREMTAQYPTLARMDVIGVAQMALVRAVLHCRSRFAVAAMVETVVRKDLLTLLGRDKSMQPLPEVVAEPHKEPAEVDPEKLKVLDDVLERMTLTAEQRTILWKWAGHSHTSNAGPSEAFCVEIGVPHNKLRYLLRRLRQIGQEVTLPPSKRSSDP